MANAQSIFRMCALIQRYLKFLIVSDGVFLIHLGQHTLQKTPMSLDFSVLPMGFWRHSYIFDPKLVQEFGELSAKEF